MMDLRRLPAAAAVVAACAMPSSSDEREAALREIRALHERDRRAHLLAAPETLLANQADTFISVARGAIALRPRDSVHAFFTRYFEGARYEAWDDLEPPIVRVADDGSMGWAITRVKVRRSQPDSAGREQRQEFVYAGIMIYERRGDRWIRTANVSTFE